MSILNTKNVIGFRLGIFIFLLINLSCGKKQETNEIIVCGDHLVMIVENDLVNESPNVKWKWSAHEETEFSEEVRYTRFETIDECKPVNHGKKILITSSAGGIALIERATKKIEFYQEAANAHSAEILPNNRIAIVASIANDGNKLEIYDIDDPSTAIITDSLYSGHGVVWDNKDQILYVLGHSLLKAYQLVNWTTDNPKLQIFNQWIIPGNDGHDLQPDPNSGNLIMTERSGVWLFDTKKGTFKKYPGLSDKRDVKSVSINPDTNELIYVQAEEQWWSHHVQFFNKNKSLPFPQVKIYKARWNVHASNH